MQLIDECYMYMVVHIALIIFLELFLEFSLELFLGVIFGSYFWELFSGCPALSRKGIDDSGNFQTMIV